MMNREEYKNAVKIELMKIPNVTEDLWHVLLNKLSYMAWESFEECTDFHYEDDLSVQNCVDYIYNIYTDED